MNGNSATLPAMQGNGEVAVDLFEYGALILRMLEELHPARVACVAPGVRFEQLLAEYAAALGFELVAEPSSADLVLCSASDYATVRGLLEELHQQPLPVLMGGTAWPCARRDARARIDDLAADDRRRYAFRIPLPGRATLGEDHSPIAFATVEGGPGNGVLTAIEDVCNETPSAWEVRLVPGFGGAAVLLPAALASDERWAAIVPSDLLERSLARLDIANVQLRLDRARLLRELEMRDRELAVKAREVQQQLAAFESRLASALADAEHAASELRARAASALDEHRHLERWLIAAANDAGERLRRERERSQARERALAAEQATCAALTREFHGLSLQFAQQTQAYQDQLAQQGQVHNDQLTQYENDRAFAIEQVRRIAASGAWRWGHRIALLKTRLTLRRSHGTDAVTRLLERLTERPQLTAPAVLSNGQLPLPDTPQLAAAERENPS